MATANLNVVSCFILFAAGKPESYCIRLEIDNIERRTRANWSRLINFRGFVSHVGVRLSACKQTVFPPTKHLVGSEVACGCVKFAFDQRQVCLTPANDISSAQWTWLSSKQSQV